MLRYGVVAQALRPTQGRFGRAQEVIKRLGAKFRQIQGGIASLAPPPIVGLGTGGGFTYVLKDLRDGDPKALAQVVRGSWWQPTKIRN